MKNIKLSMNELTLKEIGRVGRLLSNSGYKENHDFRINFFENNGELIIMNESLCKELKALSKLKLSDLKKCKE